MAINVLLKQSFTHMAGSEEEGKAIIEKYREEYDINKSTNHRKVKKGSEYWVVTVEVTHIVEKDAFDAYISE